MSSPKTVKPDPNLPHGRFKEDTQDYTYLRDVAYLLATERRQKRIVLSGEIISSIDELKAVLTTKLGMQSTNVRKAFRRLDQDYSGTLDRLEFKRFLENLNVHCTISAFNGAFALLDTDGSGTVEFGEFMKEFGPEIAGAELPVMLDGEARMALKFEELVRKRELRAGAATFTAEQARVKLTEKLSTMSSSVRKIFSYANSDYQREGEVEGGLSAEEFKQLLDKFNIPMSDKEYRRLYDMLDPDGSGCLTYQEFQKEFGETINGGEGQVIRWGATAVPNHHKAAKEWSELAGFAEVYSSGPDVQSGGSVVSDQENEKGHGFLVQKADAVLSEHANRDAGFEKEVRIQKKLDELKKLGGSKPMHDWDKRMNEERQKIMDAISEEETGIAVNRNAPSVPSLPVADMVAKAASGAKLTKSEFMLQRRQMRDQSKLMGRGPRFGGPNSSRSSQQGNSPVSDRGGGLSLMQQQSSARSDNNGAMISSRSNRSTTSSSQGGRCRSDGGGGPPPLTSRSQHIAQSTPRANAPEESAARMRDALDQARKRMSSAASGGDAMTGGDTATRLPKLPISPVSASGAMQGERPGLPNANKY